MTDQQSFLPNPLPEPTHEPVALSKLQSNEKLRGPDPSATLVESVKKHGVINPIVLIRSRGALKVGAGRRRIKASRAAERTEIPAMIYDFGSQRTTPRLVQHLVTLIENSMRTQNHASELEAIEALVAENKTEDEIAAETGMKKQTIRARMKLLRLRDDLRERWKSGDIKTSIAERVATLSDDDQQQLAKREKIRHDDVKEIRSAKAASIPKMVFETPGADEIVADATSEKSASINFSVRTLFGVEEQVKRLIADIMRFYHIVELHSVANQNEVVMSKIRLAPKKASDDDE